MPMCNGLARVMHTQDAEAANSNELLRKAASALFICGFPWARRLRSAGVFIPLIPVE